MAVSPGSAWLLAWACLAGCGSAESPALARGEVVYAINAGGEAHVDSWGVRYARDPLLGRGKGGGGAGSSGGAGAGTASDYGKQLGGIGRVAPQDRILYQTERYHHSTFGYDIPADGDGDYVLVLKFCEVYFGAPDMKVFDVVLNGDHTVVSDLDIFEKVGRGVAHDEYVPFSVRSGKLYYEEEESDIRGNMIRVEFIKGFRDNPKINALYVVRGSLDRVPKLPPLAREADAEPEDQPDEDDREKERERDRDRDRDRDRERDKDRDRARPNGRKPSGPRQPDPYAVDDTSVMLPVFVAIGAFVPLLFCLCKL